MRSLLLHSLSQAGLGLRRIDSKDIPDTSKVAVTAQAVAAKRNDAALEQIVGRLSLEPLSPPRLGRWIAPFRRREANCLNRRTLGEASF